MVPNAGWWFAYPSPSHADMIAHQEDYWSCAVAWGRTRKECAEAFLSED